MQAPHSHMQKAALLLGQEISDLMFSDESATTAGPTLHIDVALPEASYFLLDVVVDRSGRVRLIEANGSNAAGSSAHGRDVPRAEHIVATVLARRGDREGQPLVLLGHQRGTPCLPEILTRAGLVASILEHALGSPVDLVSAGTALAIGRPTVVTAPIDELVKYVTVAGNELLYLGARVDFVSNANLAPALDRHGHHIATYDVFHEGRAAAVVLDKVAQQRWAAEAGMVPLPSIEAVSVDDAVQLTASSPLSWFVKMRAGSGGTGVVCIPPNTSPVRAERLIAKSLDGATEKYGNLNTAFPLGVFQFADTAPACLDDEEYLWDLRVEVIGTPEGVDATPLSARRCPMPFDATFSPESVIVNLSGRNDGNNRVMDPFSLTEALKLPDTTADNVLETMTKSSAAWAIAVTKACS